MNIKELTLEQLKALAYDELAKREQAEINLKTLNQEIASRIQNEVQEPVVTESTEESE